MSRWTWWRTTRTTRTRQTTGDLRSARCPLGAPMLQSYLDGELEAPAAARVRTHVAECHRCARELAVYQRISEALAARGTTDEIVLDRLRDFAAVLADREGHASGTEAAPTEPVPGTETVPGAAPTEAEPEPVPGRVPGSDRDADQGAVHKAGG
ncbi:hypothetical protein CGL27_22615 [Streptomyces sp. 11-1-2]|nr:hypothetical protein CGL27_22615 [Streptomyces sp. 11-1-2]